MASVREIVLNRQKRPAKIQPMEAGTAVQVTNSLVVQHKLNAAENFPSGEETHLPSALTPAVSRPKQASQLGNDPSTRCIPQSLPLVRAMSSEVSREPGTEICRPADQKLPLLHGPHRRAAELRRQQQPAVREPRALQKLPLVQMMEAQQNRRPLPAGDRGRSRGPAAAAYMPAPASAMQRRPNTQNQQVTRAQGEERQHVPLPLYLRRRKQELSEERRRAAEPPELEPPPGYRRVGPREQQQTLETLARRRDAVVKSQDKLPIRIETLGQRRRERELKERLQHLDKLIGMFSKPIVFVPSDSEPICDVAPVESPRRYVEVNSQVEPTGMPSGALAQQRLSSDVIRGGAAKSIVPLGGAAEPVYRLPMQPPGGKSVICLQWDC